MITPFLDVEDRRRAFGAEGEPEPSAFVTDPDELRAIALDGHRPAGEDRLRAEDAAGSALAGVSVADGDTDRVSADLRPKLSATAKRDANRRRTPRETCNSLVTDHTARVRPGMAEWSARV
jgi:hypothetical protein